MFVTLGGLDSTATSAGYRSRGLAEIIGSGTGLVLSLVGLIFLIMMIAGGIIWMTAQGNDAQVGKAKALIIAAVIGLIIVIAAYAITAYLGHSTLNLLSV